MIRINIRIPRIIMFQKLITYLKETRLEMRKVNWPSRRDTIRFTTTVVAVSLAIAVLLGTFDFIFRRLISLLV
ncbi:preprotein translocase subunit SecE [Candidatus Giovannonibacteria bacterium RIFCSPHIGHO2_02_FULL_46_20]|uniref:Protein translocase subunit SecE n=1 Tax=Candidatus Giovannonibacteria bacterium RIFCSPHIGHO2_02_FULL_46_20 TaxID=1798338 RepID=A0A1F5WDK7_9BACT|nr:MAG: preprotein translocase subunit SecE [Candidatus Giovannonibacteria bacterium RIFCSPHIGHO2_02_FULL_46_20]